MADKAAGRGYQRRSEKPTMFAAVERKGRVRARVIPDRKAETLSRVVKEHVLPSSMIFTDDFNLYRSIGEHFRGHRRINHSQRVYVEGTTHTNSVEGFFGLFKSSVRGAHHAISAEYLQNYLDEYTFRWNARYSSTPVFWLILDRVRKGGLAVA